MLIFLVGNGVFPAQLIQLGQTFTGGIPPPGSDHSVIKTIPRYFLEGKEVHPGETMCLWPRGELGHGKQEKVSGIYGHSPKQILQLPVSKLLNAEQEFSPGPAVQLGNKCYCFSPTLP